MTPIALYQAFRAEAQTLIRDIGDLACDADADGRRSMLDMPEIELKCEGIAEAMQRLVDGLRDAIRAGDAELEERSQVRASDQASEDGGLNAYRS